MLSTVILILLVLMLLGALPGGITAAAGAGVRAAASAWSS